MQIIWYGQSCFQIISNQGKNNIVNIVIDPFDKNIGLNVPRLKAEIALISHQHNDHNNIKAVLGDPFVIDSPGEYEIKDVFIQGLSAFHDNVKGKERGEVIIYTIELNGISICHLSDLCQNELTVQQLDKIGAVDILMIPVGGVYTISAKEATKIISQIEPKIIIPMHYQIPKLKLKLDKLENFLEVIGKKTIEPQNKLTIKKKDLLGKDKEVVILKT